MYNLLLAVSATVVRSPVVPVEVHVTTPMESQVSAPKNNAKIHKIVLL